MKKPPRPPRRCAYAGSHRTSKPVFEMLDDLVANAAQCSSMYLDTLDQMSKESDDHHQSIARTHRLSDGSVWYFLGHSETDDGQQGSISTYRYDGPLDEQHIIETSPRTVAPMKQFLKLDGEQHPSDICFLGDVDHADAGYLFVTEESDKHRLSVYRWSPETGLNLHGHFPHGFPVKGPSFAFIDLVGDTYFLGVASNHWSWVAVYSAKAADLFPGCKQGAINLDAFRSVCPGPLFPFAPAGTPAQMKLIRDSLDEWYLLAFRGDPEDDQRRDYVDVYKVQFEPFILSGLIGSVHVKFRGGDTGFATSGSHHVEASGRMLLMSSYRWSKDEGPGDSDYVSRVDEVPSS